MLGLYRINKPRWSRALCGGLRPSPPHPLSAPLITGWVANRVYLHSLRRSLFLTVALWVRTVVPLHRWETEARRRLLLKATL